jgi:hypothetical protein
MGLGIPCAPTDRDGQKTASSSREMAAANITEKIFRTRRLARWPGGPIMIRKLSSGQYRLYSRKKDPKTARRRNLGTFKTRAAAERHERAVQYFKRAG